VERARSVTHNPVHKVLGGRDHEHLSSFTIAGPLTS